MAAAVQNIFIPTITILLLLCSGRSLSANDNALTPGGPAVSSSFSLVSPNGLFTLGFRRVSSDNYLVICYKNDTNSFFWVANREFPIRDDSGALSLDGNGTLKLTYSGAAAAIELYTSPSNRGRSTAVLDDTGNFALRDDGSGEALWQSFDHPADSWLLGAKLGVVNGGRQNRRLTSWLTSFVPSPGAFALEWDPAREELVMTRRGVVLWTSGKQLAADRFQNLDLSFMTLGFNLTRTRASGEDYLTFAATTTDRSHRSERNFTIWRLGYDGGIQDQSFGGSPVLSNDHCDWNTTADGCRRLAGPACRRQRDGEFLGFQRVVVDRNSPRVRVENNGSLSFSDCQDTCWRECKCGGTTVDGSNGNGTGCVFLYGKFEFADYDDQEAEMCGVILDKDYGTSNSGAGASARRRKKWIIGGSVAAAGGALLLLMLAVVICILRRRRRRKLRAERLLTELIASDAQAANMDEMEHDGDRGHQLKVYGVAVIITATNNFSLQNKLGQGGFGPVYKGKLSEGREIAIKSGYMSPEYAMNGNFSIKSDVFSYGVLLLEILSGRKNHGLIQLDPPINLVGYVSFKLFSSSSSC
ncbi:unnamed protein product [Linum tenue]|uniref:Bulb-type lectin domain-containing protein n=1 Tax=Linum tenue TaxID=586396 RepID=A0AAV0NGF6_9ROSI|nr:unnamed protein product [Linum tenue]